MKLYICADKNWAIGKGDRKLVEIPRVYKKMTDDTYSKVIVMGRKTYESLPGGRSIYGRNNIVITHSNDIDDSEVTTVHSIEELLEESKRYDTDDITIIGGESIFRQLLPYCDTIEAAIIDYEYDADRHIDNIDKLISWQCYDESEEETYFDIAYHFKKYKKTIY